MVYLIKSIGLLIVIWGVLLAALPSLMLRVLAFAKVGKRAYFAGVLRIIIGGLLIWACRAAMFVWVPATFGAIMVISGILIFVLGMDRVHAVMGWWEARTERVRRLVAILAACIGALLIYSS
ncbi:MAG: hypothetical protein WC956_02175 [bacterium]